ncbi:hypothetical protein HPB48_006615 [Haemaphysalis longicornis]|uniref:Neurotransmitter-gated ion-channel ligand-binding domain-containing protein n=1 Tax=Haemaphysalis longicornis TaxID=44386 RepID=A0A9J6GMN1_HAELO|nr:hypothetical protein HPB48_006615 [Haemaphysalis longicornis]
MRVPVLSCTGPRFGRYDKAMLRVIERSPFDLTRGCLLASLADSEQGPHERRLLADLLANYNTLERPVLNESEPLILSFGLTLQQIIDVVSLRLPNRKDYHHLRQHTLHLPDAIFEGPPPAGGPDCGDSTFQLLAWELGQEVYRGTRLR